MLAIVITRTLTFSVINNPSVFFNLFLSLWGLFCWLSLSLKFVTKRLNFVYFVYLVTTVWSFLGHRGTCGYLLRTYFKRNLKYEDNRGQLMGTRVLCSLVVCCIWGWDKIQNEWIICYTNCMHFYLYWVLFIPTLAFRFNNFWIDRIY